MDTSIAAANAAGRSCNTRSTRETNVTVTKKTRVRVPQCPLRHQRSSVGEYLTSREAAEYLHVNHRTLLEWARQGVIPGIPLGGSQRKTWLFCRSVMDARLRAMMTYNRPRSAQETEYVN